MKSEWRVTSNVINGQKMYGVYRTIRVGEVDYSGNRETHGGYTLDREVAVVTAEKLNREGN